MAIKSNLVKVCIVLLLASILTLFILFFFPTKKSLSEKLEYDFSLTEQFEYWKDKRPTFKAIEKIRNWDDKKKEPLRLAFIQIVNNKIYYEYYCSNNDCEGRALPLLNTLHRLIKSYDLSNMYFIIVLRDEIVGGYSELRTTPIFLMSKDTTLGNIEEHMLLLPDTYMLASKSWKNLVTKIEQASKNRPFENKVDKVFWRGGSTGGTFDYQNYKKLARGKLVDYSEKYPDLIDAKFSHIVQTQGGEQGELFKRYFLNKTERVSPEKHLKYKYLVSVDGNTCAWMRVPWILLSNSVLLKQETPKIQWFYSGLKPYKHYIPLNENIEDIFEQLQWAKNNPQETKKIAEEASNFVRRNLLSADIDRQTVIILNEYAKLQNFTLDRPTLKNYFLPLTKWQKFKQRLKRRYSDMKKYFSKK